MSLRMLFAIFASEILRFIFAPYNENRMPWREQSILKVSLIMWHLLHRRVLSSVWLIKRTNQVCRVLWIMSNHRDLWYLRHWLQYWQLRTWIHDNLCYLTINCDTGQHSQFLRCLWIQCELPVRNHDTSSPKNFHELTFSDMWRLLRRQMFHTCWGEFIYLFF